LVTVVKVGGSLVAEGKLQNVLSDVPNALKTDNLVLVHGGGEIVTRYAERLGKEQRFITSPTGVRSRYTDQETAEIYSMVMSGLIAGRIVSELSKHGVPAFSLSGIDGGLIRAERKKRLLMVDDRGRKIAIEGGFTGKPKSVNKAIIENILSMGFTPVISPVAIGDESEILNIDGDRAASFVASSIRSDNLVILTNVGGVILDGDVIGSLTIREAKQILPKVGAGMDKKIIGAVEAVESGVGRCVIAPGKLQHPITTALSGRVGTVVKRE
jgi:acetylglutamate/LysW-gamma-L-alpha-aminoadipate kinase